MKTIKIDAPELLRHLKANRDKHFIEYTEALMGWRLAVIDAFTDGLKKAKKHEDFKFTFPVKPTSFMEQYDTIIEQLEWSLDSVIELDQHEFKLYVQDQWDWKQNFNLTASLYKSN